MASHILVRGAPLSWILLDVLIKDHRGDLGSPLQYTSQVSMSSPYTRGALVLVTKSLAV